MQVRVARADVPGLQVLEPAAGERVRGKRKRVSQKKKTGGGEGEWTAPGWKNAPRERERGDERGCGLAPGSSLSLSVSPTSYCEFTRSRSLVDAIFLSISEITLAVGDPFPIGLMNAVYRMSIERSGGQMTLQRSKDGCLKGEPTKTGIS